MGQLNQDKGKQKGQCSKYPKSGFLRIEFGVIDKKTARMATWLHISWILEVTYLELKELSITNSYMLRIVQ